MIFFEVKHAKISDRNPSFCTMCHLVSILSINHVQTFEVKINAFFPNQAAPPPPYSNSNSNNNTTTTAVRRYDFLPNKRLRLYLAYEMVASLDRPITCLKYIESVFLVSEFSLRYLLIFKDQILVCSRYQKKISQMCY